MSYINLKVLYINLDESKERNINCLSELNKIGFTNIERISAVKHDFGAIGCTMSHLVALKKAKDLDLEYVIICEDDITMTNPILLKTQLNYLFNSKIYYDVFMLGVNINKCSKINDNIYKVEDGQTTTMYIVRKHYYRKLFDNFKESVLLLNQSKNKPLHAVDMYMKKLQKEDTWLMFNILTVNQLPDYSFIEKRYVDYTHYMLKKINDNSNNMEIFILPRGGFGNILFNVLNGMALQKKYNSKLYFIYNYNDKRPKINEYRLFGRLNFKNVDKQVIHYKEKEFQYNEIILSNSNYIIDGYFQSYKYFYNNIIEFKQNLFSNIPDIVSEMTTFYNNITKNMKTVLVHFRLTDYITLQDTHPIPNDDYYVEGINNFDNNYMYLIFSDDILTVKKYDYVNNIKNKIFIEETDTEKSFVLMTLCDNYIISNSSFSLLAYYFRNNINARIIAPKIWFGSMGPKYNMDDIIQTKN
jgi:glycosyl transferase family 25